MKSAVLMDVVTSARRGCSVPLYFVKLKTAHQETTSHQALINAVELVVADMEVNSTGQDRDFQQLMAAILVCAHKEVLFHVQKRPVLLRIVLSEGKGTSMPVKDSVYRAQVHVPNPMQCAPESVAVAVPVLLALYWMRRTTDVLIVFSVQLNANMVARRTILGTGGTVPHLDSV
jgi:hypothetical protein